MIRNLLATTALATFVATGAYAQNATNTAPATPAVQEPAAAPVPRAEGSIVTNIIGESVYNGTGDDAENIGKVSDVVFDKDGQAKSVVIDVGGFLGVGAKSVAFDYGKLQWAEKNGDRWLVAQTTKDELTAQAEFDKKPYSPTPAPAASTDATAPAAPATTDTAQKPVDMNAASAEPVKRADGNLATNIIGENVYNGTGDDAQNIGDVNDIVLTKDGKAQYLVIGVGGFLGLGAKNVTYDFSKAQWAEKNGDRWLVAQTTKEELQAQPDFNRKAYDPAPATTASNAPAAVAPAAAPAVAPSDKTAQAPAPTTPDASAPDQTKTAAIDKSTLTEMPVGEIRADDLKGTTVYGANDAKVGEIGDVVLAPDKKADAVIVDVGGFLGIGEKEVAVGMDNLKFMTDKAGNKYLYTTFTKEQLEAQTAYDKGSYAEKRDQQRMIVR
ncbi:PRC-barrel domain containing protein [Mesorhizobium sp. M7A.F.Ca.US.006.04.2.1]|uniref:PRC-barrel domain-containing protein n=1 Tax=unclassified Mesorhizobium TaxID=325217 RepID=UPI000FCCBBFE|nr:MULTISPECIES: PRC-barrel domain-containing protein [unclassified Mesorhizobium]RUX73770.1 PRC-barrel domain containing protein [Mesorhizobium sp. M7A.F.Ca.US.005.03.1.1]RUY17971.1 PRC-barrel domain containing protein [Mesorhizobium sp. M7A.F.Ca.US.005.03.2.1]RUY28217.1 PRC-barrel domain containing protein [Mesorhizobium sp. M7A.F.Ca.US.001.04.2.1]RVA14314.1 PRC-barrel domain containing protein [Mesorhizobium sp. M7A.F.Ca.US.002.01.1.1]RVA80893.1 PRC-barrel domain containing protein [Mesorhi